MKKTFERKIKPRRSRRKLKPYGDYDLDGTLNYKDCDPYDPSKDGIFGRIANVISGGRVGQSKESYYKEREEKKYAKETKRLKAYARKGPDTDLAKYYRKKEGQLRRKEILQKAKKTFMKTGDKVTKVMEKGVPIVSSSRSQYGGRVYKVLPGKTNRPSGLVIRSSKRRLKKNRQTTYGRTTGKVGRPPGSYRHINPKTGRGMPAQEWYKLQRALKRRAQAIAQLRDTQETQALAKRGIPPEQAKVIVDSRQIRSVVRSMPVVRPQQAQVVSQQAQIQSEIARIQQLEPWARAQAMRNLQRRVRIDERVQNEGRTRQPQQLPQRQEVSLMTGRPVLRSPDVQNKEAWTR